MPNSEVQLEAAFVWTCEGCGRINYGRFITVEFNDEQKQEIKEELGEEPKIGDWLCLPNRVRCKRCKTRYAAIPIGGYEDDDDE